MSFTEMFILSSLEAIMLTVFTHSILGRGESNGKWLQRVALVLLHAILVGLADTLVEVSSLSHILSGIIAYTYVVIYIKMIFNRKMSFGTMMFFVVMILGLFTQVLTVLVLRVVYDEFDYNFISGVYSMLSTLLIALAIAYSQKLKVIEKYCTDKGYFRFKITVTLLFMAYYMVSVVWSLDFSKMFESFLSIIVVMILTIFVSNMFVKENVLVMTYEDKIDSYETYLKIIDDIIEEVRATQHDYHNHIQTLISLSESDQSSTRDYAHELVDKDIWRDLLALDNKILTALFYSKFKMAKEKNIDLIFDLKNKGFTTDYQIFDIVEMYGILMDNAIEATEEGGKIKISMDRYEAKNRFEVTNPHAFISSKDIRQFFAKNYSTKSTDKRGIGLYKLKAKLLKKDDQIYFSYNSDEQMVIAQIEHA